AARRQGREDAWASANPQPEGAEAWYLQAQLAEAVDDLPDAVRRVIRMRLLGHSAVEIGAQLGLAAATVRWRQAQGVALLRERLGAPPRRARALACLPTYGLLMKKTSLLVAAAVALATTGFVALAFRDPAAPGPATATPAGARGGRSAMTRARPPDAAGADERDRRPATHSLPTFASSRRTVGDAPLAEVLESVSAEVVGTTDRCADDLEIDDAGVMLKATAEGMHEHGRAIVVEAEAQSVRPDYAECVRESAYTLDIPSLGEDAGYEIVATANLSRHEAIGHFAADFYETLDALPNDASKLRLVASLEPHRHASYLHHLDSAQRAELLSWMDAEVADAFVRAAADYRPEDNAHASTMVQVSGT
ncbi:MAG: hypothetical protein AAF721_37350, partial [Myxococcota bacterium]